MEWQPIETCPKDGSEFLTYDATNTGYYNIGVYDKEDEEVWMADYDCSLHATHWMPLPPPPKP